MGRQLTRIESNERVDLTDFEFLANTSLRDIQRDPGDQFYCDPVRDRKWVIKGFAMTNPAAKQLTVTMGKAILAYRVSGAIQYGMLTSEGDATKTVDLNGWAAVTYGIYVRFEYVPGTAQSRIFWDPTGTGSEFAQTINTRFHANWSVRVEASNPGDEWLKIGEVAQGAMAITDQRGLYFEGEVHNSYESGWSTEGGGVANDRNADRQQYGVTDVQMFSAAMRQCITDIRGRGLKEWYEKGIGGMNIGFDTDPTVDKLAVKDANFHLTGSATVPELGFDDKDALVYNRAGNRLSLFLNDVEEIGFEVDVIYPVTNTATIDLGKAALKFRDIWLSRAAYAPEVHVTNTYPAHGAGEGCTDHWVPATVNVYDLGNATYRWRDLFLAHGVVAGGVTNPAAGDGIFANGLVVGYDGAPAASEIRLQNAASRIVGAATPSLTLYGGAGCYYQIDDNADTHIWYVAAAAEMVLTTTALRPNAAVTIGLGTITEWFGTGHMTNLKLYDSVDGGGTNDFTTITGRVADAGDGANGAVANAGGHASTGWLKIYVDTVAAWIPYWADITT